MTTMSNSGPTESEQAPPTGWRAKFRQVGPGLLAAATGVGAGDLVATMVAGARFGTVLLWAAVLGTVLKLALAEGVGPGTSRRAPRCSTAGGGWATGPPASSASTS